MVSLVVVRCWYLVPLNTLISSNLLLTLGLKLNLLRLSHVDCEQKIWCELAEDWPRVRDENGIWTKAPWSPLPNSNLVQKLLHCRWSKKLDTELSRSSVFQPIRILFFCCIYFILNLKFITVRSRPVILLVGA